jgi:hypothetical protein
MIQDGSPAKKRFDLLNDGSGKISLEQYIKDLLSPER